MADHASNDYVSTPVPKEERRKWWEITFVTAGFSLAVSGMFAGAALSSGMSLVKVIITILIGNLILTFIGGAMGAIGAKTGVSTSMIAGRTFGTSIASFISFLWGITLIGWFSVQTGFFGQTIDAMIPTNSFLTSPPVAAVWGGVLMILTAFIGYKGIRILSNIAIPLLLLLAIAGTVLAVNHAGGWALLPEGTGDPLSIIDGVVIVVGTFAVGAVIQPDITRYAFSAKDSWIAMFLGMILANGFIIFAGAVTALAMGTGDLPAAMIQLGLGVAGILVLIAAQWTSNDSNLYSASLSFSNVFKTNRQLIVIIVGVIGTILGAAGIANYFVNWLSALGIVIPPIAGVVIADYYLVRSKKYDFTKENMFEEKVVWPAFLGWVFGILAGVFLPFGIASLNSLIVSLIVHYVLMKMMYKSPSKASQV